MQSFITQLNKTLETDLQHIKTKEPDTLKAALQAANCIANALNHLKAFVLAYTFKDEAEEIWFFKEAKPDLQNKHIYYRKIAKIESLRPVGCHEEQEKYLKERLQKLTFFFNEHKEFYQYYRIQSTHLDDKYFVRRRIDSNQKMNNTEIGRASCRERV